MPQPGPGRLLARSGGMPASGDRIPTGIQGLELGTLRDGVIYVPKGYEPDRPAPLQMRDKFNSNSFSQDPGASFS